MPVSNNFTDPWTTWKVVLYALFIVSLLLGVGRVARSGELLEKHMVLRGPHATRIA